VFAARFARLGQIEFARGKPNLTGLLAVDENDGERVDVLRRQRDASSVPVGRYREIALVPSRGEIA